MCEPHHSINQFKNNDEDGNPRESFLASAFEKIGSWTRKIGDFFHYSKLGSGHSEALRYQRNHTLYIPEPVRYETSWWSREVKLDDYCPHYIDKEESLDAAKIYSDHVCIGDLGKLRRFLEVSIERTNKPHLYFEAFRQMLNPKGRHIHDARLNAFKHLQLSKFSRLKLCLGLTRKRDLLVPEWADDNKLWIPNGSSACLRT